MNKIAHRSVSVFGICVMFASLFSGCAATRTDRVPMDRHSLNHFQKDCKKKEQQVALLQSMRQTKDERMLAGFETGFNPLMRFTNPHRYQQLQDIYRGQTNWDIDYNLIMLERLCP